MVAAPSFLHSLCSNETIVSDSRGVNVILTTLEIYDEETATMLNISIHCQGSSVNIISSKVFSNSVKLQPGRKTHSARRDHQTKRCHHHCFRINNFPIKIQIKFTPPTHFCFMVVSTHWRLWIHPRLQFSAWIKIISPIKLCLALDRAAADRAGLGLRLRAIFSLY